MKDVKINNSDEINVSKITIENIKIVGKRSHTKASEEYVDVEFTYPESGERWHGSVPIEYRRTGVSVKTREDVVKILTLAYEAMKPENAKRWIQKEDKYWGGRKAKVTEEFYHSLKDSIWKCRQCELPDNPNFARRIQALKEAGYTLSTNTNKYCEKCGKATTHLVMLKLPRGVETGYEVFSKKLRTRILKTLGKRDAYEDQIRDHLLPDHKFPEIRWDDETREENPDDMSNEDILEKFQLLNNQRNQQKREVCRTCYQTNVRGSPFGIKYYYKGDEKWPPNIPKKGREAEKGCLGCGWYDLSKWRFELTKISKEKGS